MANPEQLPPDVMARKFGVGKLSRHLFICIGPDCCDPALGERSWDHLKRRLKQLELAGTLAASPCYRTKCACLRICTRGPVGVVYPEGTWYRDLTPDNLERVIEEHVVNGRVVEELCFARNPLPEP